MARRNHFLVVTLLVMVAVLIAAILSTEDRDGSGDRNSQGPSGLLASLGEDGAADRGDPDAGDAGSGPGAADPDRQAAEDPPVPAAAGGRVRITGQLRGDAELTTAGVTLEYRPVAVQGVPWLENAGSGDEGGADPTGALRAETDAEGRFAFEVEPSRAGRIRLVRAAGLLFAQNSLRSFETAASDQNVELGSVPVEAAAVLRGVVVGAAGEPLTAARVRANSVGAGLTWQPGTGLQVDATTATFEIRGLEAGTVRIVAACPGYVPQQQELELEAGGVREEFRLELRRGASVAGTVFDDRGVPLAGARVAAARGRSAAAAGGVEALNEDGAVTTDDHGYFVLASNDLDRESARVQAWADGHVAHIEDGLAVGTGNLQFHLDRLGVISGTLVDRSMAPFEGTEIIARATGPAGARPGVRVLGAGERSATTAEDGSFRIEGVAPGSVLVRAVGRGHLPVQQPCQLEPGQSVTHLRLVAETGAGVAVQVFGPDNLPVAGAEVVIREPQPEGAKPAGGPLALRGDGVAGPEQGLGRGITDAEGRVLIGGLPPGAASVGASHASFAPAREQRLALPRSGVVEAVLTLRPAGFVVVKVLDGEDRPRPGTTLELRPTPADPERAVLRSTTGADGTVRIGPQLPGDYVAQLLLPPRPVRGPTGLVPAARAGASGKDLAGASAPVTVEPGAVEELTVRFPVLTRLHGVVRDAEGVVPGVVVELATPADAAGRSTVLTARTDAEGRYELVDLEAGTWQLHWQREADLIAHRDGLEIPAGTPELVRDLQLTRGSVRVQVRSATLDGPLVGARVHVERPGAAIPGAGELPAPTRTDERGVAVLAGVPAGAFVLRIEHGAHALQRTAEVQVQDGGETDAGEVELIAGGAVAGSLTGWDDGDPQEAALLVFTRTDAAAANGPREELVIGRRFRIGSVAPGTYEVVARPLTAAGFGEPGPPQTVEVTAVETTMVELPVR